MRMTYLRQQDFGENAPVLSATRLALLRSNQFDYGVQHPGCDDYSVDISYDCAN